jgi:hypothetical protein
VAELEATTVRKGNKKVSVTLSGWVVKSGNFWDDGDIDHFVVGNKDYDLGTRFAITARRKSHQVGPEASTSRSTPGPTVSARCPVSSMTSRAVSALKIPSSSFREAATTTRHRDSCIYIKSDTYGAVNWGHLSPASDNAAVLADISGTVIETNAVWFEGSTICGPRSP